MFLSIAELRRLTGTSDKREQLGWLAKERISHRVNMAGQIIVTRAAVDSTGDRVENWTPDYSSLRA